MPEHPCGQTTLGAGQGVSIVRGESAVEFGARASARTDAWLQAKRDAEADLPNHTCADNCIRWYRIRIPYALNVASPEIQDAAGNYVAFGYAAWFIDIRCERPPGCLGQFLVFLGRFAGSDRVIVAEQDIKDTEQPEATEWTRL